MLHFDPPCANNVLERIWEHVEQYWWCGNTRSFFRFRSSFRRTLRLSLHARHSACGPPAGNSLCCFSVLHLEHRGIVKPAFEQVRSQPAHHSAISAWPVHVGFGPKLWPHRLRFRQRPRMASLRVAAVQLAVGPTLVDNLARSRVLLERVPTAIPPRTAS